MYPLLIGKIHGLIVYGSPCPHRVVKSHHKLTVVCSIRGIKQTVKELIAVFRLLDHNNYSAHEIHLQKFCLLISLQMCRYQVMNMALLHWPSQQFRFSPIANNKLIGSASRSMPILNNTLYRTSKGGTAQQLNYPLHRDNHFRCFIFMLDLYAIDNNTCL